MDSLTSAVSQMISVSDQEAREFVSMCTARSYKKKAILRDGAKTVDEVYFIVKGILRVKILHLDGKEHTTHFALENEFIAEYTAFLTRSKSRYVLEALEDMEVIVLPRAAIEWGYKNMTEGEKLGRLIAEYYFVCLDTRIEQMYTLSPIERYNEMANTFPNIHNRVPQHMIASYLGITPIHLSRIKRELK